MYILTFQRTRSKHFQRALNHAMGMGAEWDGETATLAIPAEDMLTAYEDLLALFEYVSRWSSLKATFRGKPVDPFRFIFQVWNTVNRCKMDKEQTNDQRHCWAGVDNRGWGCKHIRGILLGTHGSARYKTSNRYWYNFGEFVDTNLWKINKPLLIEKIRGEVTAKALFLCPHFKSSAIKDVVENLPNFVRVDNVQYTHHFTTGYVNGKKKHIPVNIRHIPPRKEMATIQNIIQNDPGRYQWN